MALYDLSKLEVIDILTTFEERLPNKGIEFFQPSDNFDPHDPNSINVEAGRMVRFMGLEGFIPIITSADLSKKHVAGTAQMGISSGRTWDITIDKATLYNNASTLKVLAHELSHKFLEHYGIYSRGLNTKLDECQTELCTIYMGMGLLTLRAYNDYSGYLNLEDFTHAFCVVYKTRGMTEEQIYDIVPPACKQYVVQFFNGLAKGDASNIIIESQRSDFEFRRRIRLLQLIFDSIPEFQEKHRKQDAIIRYKAYRVHEENHPISRMLLLEALHQNNLLDPRLERCNKEIDKLIAKLCKILPVNIDSVNQGLKQNVTCPSCGRVSERTYDEKINTVVCPQCKHYFAWDATPFIVPTITNKDKAWFSALWHSILTKRTFK